MKVVILGSLAFFVLLSTIGFFLYLHSDELFPSHHPPLDGGNISPPAPDIPTTPPAKVSLSGTATTEPITESLTAEQSTALSLRAKAIIAVVGAVILLAWMATLGFLIYRRYEALLADSLAKGQEAPGVWTVLSEIFYPRVSTTTVVTYTDDQGVVHTVLQPAPQTTEGLTERYGLVALAIGFIFGTISFTSTLVSTKSIQAAALSGSKSALISAIGQVVVLFIISYL
jgi:hypothetical protein